MSAGEGKARECIKQEEYTSYEYESVTGWQSSNSDYSYFRAPEWDFEHEEWTSSTREMHDLNPTNLPLPDDYSDWTGNDCSKIADEYEYECQQQKQQSLLETLGNFGFVQNEIWSSSRARAGYEYDDHDFFSELHYVDQNICAIQNQNQQGDNMTEAILAHAQWRDERASDTGWILVQTPKHDAWSNDVWSTGTESSRENCSIAEKLPEIQLISPVIVNQQKMELKIPGAQSQNIKKKKHAKITDKHYKFSALINQQLTERKQVHLDSRNYSQCNLCGSYSLSKGGVIHKLRDMYSPESRKPSQ